MNSSKFSKRTSHVPKKKGADDTPVLFNAIKEQINSFLHRHEKEKIDVSNDVLSDRIRLLKKLYRLEKGKGRKGEVCSKSIDGCLEFLILQETNRLNELKKIHISSSDEDDGGDDDEGDDDYNPEGEDESEGEEGEGEDGNGKRKEGEGEDGDGKRKEGEGEDGDGKR